MTKNKIQIEVSLDDDKMPEQIEWQASPQDPTSDAKAMMLSLFDRESRDTLRIDLWTKDMQIQEMDRFFFQTLRSMADSYQKATGNTELSTEMQRFVLHFGEQVGIVPPDK